MTSHSVVTTHTPRQTQLLQLVLDHRAYFLRVANRILRNEHDADDTLQNAFYSAWKAVDGFREDAAWKTWFTSIVMNKSLALLRSRRVRGEVSIDDDPVALAALEWEGAQAADTPEHALLRHESRQMLRTRMEGLPRNTRAVLHMRYFDELSVDAIALERGATKRSVQGHLMRGKKLLVTPPRRYRPQVSASFSTFA